MTTPAAARATSISTRLALLVATVTAAAFLLLALLIYRQVSASYEQRVEAGLSTSTALMRDAVALYDRSLTDSTGQMAALFRASLPPGEIAQDETQPMVAGDHTVASLQFAGVPLAAADAERVVDRFAEATHGVATLFVRNGDAFVRVATSLRNAQGERVIGTVLDPAHPAYARMLAGEVFTGPAHLFGTDYMTHYLPLKDATGEVIGISFVGQDQSSGLAALKARLRASTLGREGYFMAVDVRAGERFGTLVAASQGEGAPLADRLAADQLPQLQALLSGQQPQAVLEFKASGAAPARSYYVAAQGHAAWQWLVLGVEPVSVLEEVLHSLLLQIAVICGLALVAVVLVTSFAMRRMLARPLQMAGQVALDVAAGRLDASIPARRADEVGRLLDAMRTMQQALRDVVAEQDAMAREHQVGTISHRMQGERFQGAFRSMVEGGNELVELHVGTTRDLVGLVQAYASGDLSRAMPELPGEQRHVSDAVNDVRARLLAINGEIKRLVGAAQQGNFSARGEEAAFEHDFRDMVAGLNALMTTADDNLAELSALLRRLAQGDLRQRLEGDFQGVFAAMRDDANLTVDSLAAIIGGIQASADSVTSTAAEIAAASDDLSRRTEQQAASLEESAASMEEMTSVVRQNASHAERAEQLARHASGVAGQGGTAVGQVEATMESIQAASRRVGDITSVIDGIAFQTNILALNAAVEAARAGDQGRGFAVVASEVRALAQRSAQAAREIKTLIDETVATVDDGSARARHAGQTLSEVVGVVDELSTVIAGISSSAREQAAGIEQVNQGIVQMDSVTQQNAALVEEASASARSMTGEAEALRGAMAQFQLAR